MFFMFFHSFYAPLNVPLCNTACLQRPPHIIFYLWAFIRVSDSAEDIILVIFEPWVWGCGHTIWSGRIWVPVLTRKKPWPITQSPTGLQPNPSVPRNSISHPPSHVMLVPFLSSSFDVNVFVRKRLFCLLCIYQENMRNALENQNASYFLCLSLQ